MATHLAPGFSTSKLLLTSLTRVPSRATIRLLTASSEKSLEQEQNGAENEETPAGNTVGDKKGQDHGEDQEDHVNRETGEVGGPRGPEPTRYGDWERNARLSRTNARRSSSPTPNSQT